MNEVRVLTLRYMLKQVINAVLYLHTLKCLLIPL